VRLEMKQDVAMKEQNKVLFQMIEGMDKMAKTRRPPAAADDDDDQDEPLVILPDEEDEKFKNFHDSLNRRIQDRLPPEQMMEKK